MALYDALAEIAPSPVVELNRAVAVAWASGPAAALARAEFERAASLAQNARERALLLGRAAALRS